MASYWLDQALVREPGVPAPPLGGDIRADVCIVGGGYTGLWTALRLKELAPSLDVVVVEKDICGAGGSGSNAGYAVSLWVQFPALASLCGVEEALRLCRAAADAIDDMAAFCQRHGIDAELDRCGAIWAATCAAQAGHWDTIIEALAPHQVRPLVPLSAAEIAERTGSRAHVGGVLLADTALLQPAHLVRGLRRVALERGVRLFEHTPMTRLERRRPPVVRTPRGSVAAEKVVLALYAWSLALPELRSAVAVIGTDAAATVPVPERLDALGWAGGPGLMDSRIFVEAQRPTPDGRVVFSKAGGALPFGGRIDRCFERPGRPVAELRAVLRRVYPSLADAPLSAVWSAPIDRSRIGLPLFGALPTCPDVLYGYGYSGSGIVLSHLGGRILAALALGRDDEWARAGLVRPAPRDFPPEPFRYVGGRMVKAAIERQDRLDHEGRRPGPVTRALVRLKPASYKPT